MNVCMASLVDRLALDFAGTWPDLRVKPGGSLLALSSQAHYLKRHTATCMSVCVCVSECLEVIEPRSWPGGLQASVATIERGVRQRPRLRPRQRSRSASLIQRAAVEIENSPQLGIPTLVVSEPHSSLPYTLVIIVNIYALPNMKHWST